MGGFSSFALSKIAHIHHRKLYMSLKIHLLHGPANFVEVACKVAEGRPIERFRASSFDNFSTVKWSRIIHLLLKAGALRHSTSKQSLSDCVFTAGWLILAIGRNTLPH
jgi:hypothetical protein